MKYGFIRAHAGHLPVAHQCRLLGVPRSGYYDWRDQSARVIPAIGSHILGRQQAHGVSHGVEFPRPVMGGSTGLHHDGNR